MSNRLVSFSAAAALVAFPTLATAQTISYSAAPVAITGCSVAYRSPAFAGPYNFSIAGLRATSEVTLGYVNKGTIPATTVRVLLKDGASTQNLVASGTFAPGVHIERTVSADAGSIVSPNATCSLAEVDFADGSTWRADAKQIVAR